MEQSESLKQNNEYKMRKDFIQSLLIFEQSCKSDQAQALILASSVVAAAAFGWELS